MVAHEYFFIEGTTAASIEVSGRSGKDGLPPNLSVSRAFLPNFWPESNRCYLPKVEIQVSSYVLLKFQ